MTDQIIPSTGELRPGPFIPLNRKGYRAGERVLFERPFGHPHIDAIDSFDPNNPNVAIIDGRRTIVLDIKGRIPAGMTAEAEAALIAALQAAFENAAHLYDQHRKRILWEHGVR